MSHFETILCLIAHTPLEAALIASAVTEVDEVQGSDKVVGWDDWLEDNSVKATVENNIGRVKARAWGVSNPFTNFRSVVGAEFRFRFLIRPDQIIADELYRFDVDIRSDGRFFHTAAVPFPDDERRPPAVTFSQMDTRIEIFEIDERGNPTRNTVTRFEQDHFRSLDATNALTEDISTEITRGREFTPTGQNFIVFRVVRKVLAAATGVFSDCRIRGSEGRKRFRVIVENPRIQKVLQPGDPCFDVLNS